MLLKTLWTNRSRLSWLTFKDLLRCRKDMKSRGISDIPLLYMSEEDIRDPEHIFQEEVSFEEAFGLNKSNPFE